MEQNTPEQVYSADKKVRQLQTLLSGENTCIRLKKLSGSSAALVFYATYSARKRHSLIVLPEKEAAAYFYNDLQKLSGGDELIRFYPSAYKRSIEYSQTDNTQILLKSEILNLLGNTRKPCVLVTYPEALAENVIPRKAIKQNTLSIHEGESLSMEFIEEVLQTYGFEESDFVYEPGQYAMRGGIIDVFSFSHDKPSRIEFFGDEVESIRIFDAESQISEKRLKKLNILPNIHEEVEASEKLPLLEFISPATQVWMSDAEYVMERLEQVYKKAGERYQDLLLSDTEKASAMNPATHLCSREKTEELLGNFMRSEWGTLFYFDAAHSFNFDTSPQPAFHKNFDLLIQFIQEKRVESYTSYILSDNEKQIQRIHDILRDKGSEVQMQPVFYALHEGFIDHDKRICVFTDHQIFERYHKYHLKGAYTRKESITLKELNALKPGDFVVHVDNGIGTFRGLQKIENDGKVQEVIKVEYAQNDVLFVNIHSLHRISKFRDKELDTPNIHRLGSGHWQRTKDKAKRKVKDIARELIKLYARRQEEKGYAYSPDTYMQSELESSFIYEDTPDQYKATQSVKEDMETDTAMDRLVCGDVGFGKTEVAVRAAFKAASDTKQVALLVPTTILAYQHYHTFTDRLKDMPVSVDYISRLKSSAEIRNSLKKVAAGETDIIIGTHRLISKDVTFKSLGLLIIDEEQKFGVGVKEKLKQLRVNVDTLTLTATPIPRTLQFSLMGARDLSIINTPPPNRHPIITELHTFNDTIIREAIMYEVQRNGQVFFIHNRVQNIGEVQEFVARICPEVNTVVAHGQMEGKKLERTMFEFIRGDFDVLIATSIIENGLDIPNANTIIINNANNFGLSDLHQLRGRVGRSNKKAFCYLLAPPVSHMTSEARRRLKAVEQFNELGSGFNIAMQDLDIRGAGNLLGAEQSGFISEIGFETYQRILDEAMEELKEAEFKDLFSKDQKTEQKKAYRFKQECHIETDFEVLIPESYISSTSERIDLYRKLDNISGEEELLSFAENLEDRFGNMPEATRGLIDVVRLRQTAVKLGFHKLIIKNQRLSGHFPSDQASAFYASRVFARILEYIQHNPGRFRMKEQNGKLKLVMSEVTGLDTLLTDFKALLLFTRDNPEEENTASV